MSTERPPFPLVWDSTTIGTLRSCPRKMFLQYMEHWKPGEDSVHLIAGGAFASGLEETRKAFYVDGLHPDDAIARGLGVLMKKYGTYEAPEDSPKSWLRMAGALEYYFSEYPLGMDGAKPHIFGSGEHGIEFSFAEPLPVTHPETGLPLVYAGRSDMVADSFGGLFIYDDKTTSQLGPSWIRQWDLRSQFTGYCWAMRSHGFHPTGCVVRGVAILKTDYKTAQAITYRSDWEVDRWLAQVVRDIERAKVMWEEGYWDYNLDHACTEYGGCVFQRVCKSPDPERWLKMGFHQRVWDPLLREERPL